MQIVIALGQIYGSFSASGEAIPLNIMKNNIIYTNQSDFYKGIYELTRLGMTFTAHYDELKIELLGGY